MIMTGCDSHEQIILYGKKEWIMKKEDSKSVGFKLTEREIIYGGPDLIG